MHAELIRAIVVKAARLSHLPRGFAFAAHAARQEIYSLKILVQKNNSQCRFERAHSVHVVEGDCLIMSDDNLTLLYKSIPKV